MVLAVGSSLETNRQNDACVSLNLGVNRDFFSSSGSS